MKVLFILDHFWPNIGGGELVFFKLAKTIDSKVKKIYVVTRQDVDTSSYEKLDKRIEIFRFGSSSLGFLLKSFFKLNSLAKEVDVIHTTTYYSALPALIIAKIHKKPVIITVHEVFGRLWYQLSGRLSGFIYYLIEKFIFLLPFDYFVSVSNYTFNSLRLLYGVKSSQLSTIYNGIDYDHWNAKKYKESDSKKIRTELGLDGKFTFLYFGRLGISKGADFLVKAFSKALKSNSNLHLVMIVPKHPLQNRHKIQKLISTLKIKKSVTILDSQPLDKLPLYLKMADVLVVPSLTEGFGFTAAESCALGCPLVVSGAASLPEVVSGKIIFVKPGDSEDIARGLLEASANQFQDISAKIFSWDLAAEKYFQIYQKVQKDGQ